MNIQRILLDNTINFHKQYLNSHKQDRMRKELRTRSYSRVNNNSNITTNNNNNFLEYSRRDYISNNNRGNVFPELKLQSMLIDNFNTKNKANDQMRRTTINFERNSKNQDINASSENDLNNNSCKPTYKNKILGSFNKTASGYFSKQSYSNLSKNLIKEKSNYTNTHEFKDENNYSIYSNHLNSFNSKEKQLFVYSNNTSSIEKSNINNDNRKIHIYNDKRYSTVREDQGSLAYKYNRNNLIPKPSTSSYKNTSKAFQKRTINSFNQKAKIISNNQSKNKDNNNINNKWLSSNIILSEQNNSNYFKTAYPVGKANIIIPNINYFNNNESSKDIINKKSLNFVSNNVSSSNNNINYFENENNSTSNININSNSINNTSKINQGFLKNSSAHKKILYSNTNNLTDACDIEENTEKIKNKNDIGTKINHNKENALKMNDIKSVNSINNINWNELLKGEDKHLEYKPTKGQNEIIAQRMYNKDYHSNGNSNISNINDDYNESEKEKYQLTNFINSKYIVRESNYNKILKEREKLISKNNNFINNKDSSKNRDDDDEDIIIENESYTRDKDKDNICKYDTLKQNFNIEGLDYKKIYNDYHQEKTVSEDISNKINCSLKNKEKSENTEFVFNNKTNAENEPYGNKESKYSTIDNDNIKDNQKYYNTAYNNFSFNKNKKTIVSNNPSQNYNNNIITNDTKVKINDKGNNIKNVKTNSNSPTNLTSKDSSTTINIEISSNQMEEAFKRIFERNKKEAEAKNSNIFLNSSYMQHRFKEKRGTSQKFFNNQNYFNQKFSNQPKPKHTASGEFLIEIEPNDIDHWKKHEELWSQIKTISISHNMYKFLIPPNERDLLTYCYFRKYNIDNRLVINEKYVKNKIEEIKKWKNEYKRMVMRWHPDKLNPVINELDLDSEMIIKIKKKSASILNNLGKMLQHIIQGIKDINMEDANEKEKELNFSKKKEESTNPEMDDYFNKTKKDFYNTNSAWTNKRTKL